MIMEFQCFEEIVYSDQDYDFKIRFAKLPYQFSRKYFNGGGHINAAGGKYMKSIEETIEDFKEKIEAEDF